MATLYPSSARPSIKYYVRRAIPFAPRTPRVWADYGRPITTGRWLSYGAILKLSPKEPPNALPIAGSIAASKA